MKFSIQFDPKGEFVTESGRRVSVTPSAQGKDYPSMGAFAAAMKLTDVSLVKDRETRANQAQAQYEKAIAAGYKDDTLGLTIGISDKDQANWVAALAALSNAEAVLHIDISSQPVSQFIGPIKAIDGSVVRSDVTVAQFRSLLLSATQAIGSLRAQLAGALAANTSPS